MRQGNSLSMYFKSKYLLALLPFTSDFDGACFTNRILSLFSIRTTEGEFQGVGKKGNANVQLARILQYLECPQYLRKAFFPQHKDLQYAGNVTKSKF